MRALETVGWSTCCSETILSASVHHPWNQHRSSSTLIEKTWMCEKTRGSEDDWKRGFYDDVSDSTFFVNTHPLQNLKWPFWAHLAQLSPKYGGHLYILNYLSKQHVPKVRRFDLWWVQHHIFRDQFSLCKYSPDTRHYRFRRTQRTASKCPSSQCDTVQLGAASIGRQGVGRENNGFVGRLSGWVNRLAATGPWIAVTGRKQREAPALKGEVTRKRCVSAACWAL